MDKLCNGCHEIKDLETEFSIKDFNEAGKPYYKSKCKVCVNKHKIKKRVEYRLTHPRKRRLLQSEAEREVAKQSYKIKTQQNRIANRQWITDIKKSLTCLSCGLPFKGCWWLLDFHHRDPSTKSFELSKRTNMTKSKEVILAEIAKCDPLCANCHRTFHYLERNPTPSNICVE